MKNAKDMVAMIYLGIYEPGSKGGVVFRCLFFGGLFAGLAKLGGA